jgi:hypothetical protein
MSADDLRIEFHLTPQGWSEGTQLFFGHGERKPRPADAVETWEEHQTQSSGFSPTYCSHRLVWDDGSPQASRDALRAKFRSPFTDSYQGPLGRQP